MDTLIWNFMAAATTLACLSTIAGFLGRLGWFLELTSHFRIQYFIFLTTTSSIYLLGGKYTFGSIALLFALINLYYLLPYYSGTKDPDVNRKPYRVLLTNVLQKNRRFERVRQFIRETNPDFLVLIEVDHTWLKELEVIKRDYPFSESAPRTDNYGIAIYSRHPIQHAHVHYFGDSDRPTISAEIDLEGRSIKFVASHPAPPKTSSQANRRNCQLLEIADFIAGQSGPRFLIGDLNITPWSPYFKDLLKWSGLRESRHGFGVQPTWPTTFPLLYVPIDHILVSSDVHIRNRQLGPKIGSDHLPVIVDFSIE